MERLKELITQLQEQFDHKAEPSRLLDTVRLLEAEIQAIASQPAPARVMPTKITVMMPSASKIFVGGEGLEVPSAPAAGQITPEPGKNQGRNGVAPPAQAPIQAPVQTPVQVPVQASVQAAVPVNGVSAPTNGVVAPAAVGGVAATATKKSQELGAWPFDPLAEKPMDRFTLSQKSKEVNDVIGTGATSLNDRLRTDVSDLKSALNDSPVRDLRKAIGVNDRYVFINHLFRGDEVMYERSLKTINGFRILPEAEYWMERELKVKLGWDENNPTTRHFYQLVKRRFS